MLTAMPNVNAASKITDLAGPIQLDPSISNISVLILNGADVTAATGRSYREVISAANDKMTVLVMCQNDREAQKSIQKENVHNIVIGKMKGKELSEQVSNYLEKLSAKDNVAIIPSSDEISSDIQTFDEVNEGRKEQDNLSFEFNEDSFRPSGTTDKEFTPEPVKPANDNYNYFSDNTETDAQEEKIEISGKSFVERIEDSSLESFESMEEFRQRLDKNAIYTRLLKESATYNDIVTKLKLLEKRINNVIADKTLAAAQRLDAIRDIVSERSVLKSLENELISTYVSGIITAVTDTMAKMAVEDMNKYRTRIADTDTKNLYIGNTEKVSKAMEDRYKIQIELASRMEGINRLVNTLSNVVTESSKDMIQDVPSGNPYINTFLRPVMGFAPKDLTMHVESLFKALDQGILTLSAVEGEIRALLESTALLCSVDEETVRYQQELIDTMRVQRVEDVVIVDSTVKSALRLFIGPNDSGKTAATIIVHEGLSRRGNALIIDLTGKNKLAAYLNDVEPLEDHIRHSNDGSVTRLSVQDLNKLNIDDLIEYLKDCVPKFRDISVLLDADTGKELFAKLQHFAKAVTVVCKTNLSSLNAVKLLIREITAENIAKRVCVISPAVEALEIMNLLDAQITEYKYTPIPNITEIQACALRRANPGMITEVREVYMESFGL
jgi:hypothetical protein